MVESRFAVNLKHLRKSKHETQWQLAKALNISRSTISKWEGGILEPDNTTLIAIANHYRISIDRLLR